MADHLRQGRHAWPGSVILAASLLSSCGPEEGQAQDASTAQPGWFEEGAELLGVRFVHDAGSTEEKQLPETMGAGAALVDVNGDGMLDLYLVQSGRLPGSLGPEPRQDVPPNQLFLGQAEGAGFRDATASSGAAAHRGYGMGVAAGDVNGDGCVDLYVTNLGPDVLLLGDGTGSFRDGTREAGLGDPRWTTGAALFDPDLDGDLDLYVLGYLDVDLSQPPFCGQKEPGWRSYCHPDQFAGIADRFWQNDGQGHFEEATARAGLADNLGKGLGVGVLDFDDDGLPDLYVANDSVENRLWRGLGDGTFEDATLLSATGVNGTGATEAGMGVATGDVNGDGRTDLVVTNFDDESNTLYLNEGDGFFRDGTILAGLDAPSRLPVGFGTVLEDLDLDGDLDLVVANGHIVDNIALYHDGKSHAQPAQLFENDGAGRFTEVADPVLASPAVGRGLYAGDLDGDGDRDLLLTQCGGPARLLLRRGAQPTWSIGALPRDGRLELSWPDGRLLVRDAWPQGSYLGQSEPTLAVPLDLGTPSSIRWRRAGKDWQELELAAPLAPGSRLTVRDGRLVPLAR